MTSRGSEAYPTPEPDLWGAQIDPASAQDWEDYMAHDERTGDDIYKLWAESTPDRMVTNPGIRQRMVAVLTAPHDAVLPYAQPNSSIDELMRITGHNVRSALRGRPDLAWELAQGVLYWTGHPDYARFGMSGATHGGYQNTVEAILPLVDEQTSDQLFRMFDLTDPLPQGSRERRGGLFNPTAGMLSDNEIPYKYRQAQLDAWVAAATDEVEGRRGLARGQRSAVKRLGSTLQVSSGFRHLELPLQNQVIDFLESATPVGKGYFSIDGIMPVAANIEDEDRRLRFLLRHVPLTNSSWPEHYMQYEETRVQLSWLHSKVQGTREGVAIEPVYTAVMEHYAVWQRAQREHAVAEAALQSRLQR